MRFRWLKSHLAPHSEPYSLFELGCSDCRTLDFLPPPIQRYVGADAGRGVRLDAARAKYAHDDWIHLLQARSAEDLADIASQSFDYAVALETLEHITDELHGYLEFIRRITNKYFFATIPVEIGPVFLGKHIAKRFVTQWRGDKTGSYTFSDIFWSTVGHVDPVERFHHKGFDYRKLISDMETYFEIINVEGLPFKPLPSLSFQVGIIARPKA